MSERSGYIDIVYADDKVNGNVKHFGNVGIDSKASNRRVYGIEDIMSVSILFKNYLADKCILFF